MLDSAKILVVDDAPANLEVIVEALSSAGYTVSAVTNGKRALKQIKDYIPDLILLDIQMPDMDGFTTCERIKANAATATIPVIFLTSFSDTESIVKGFSLGAVDYISKPFQEAELLARVQTHIKIQNLAQSLKHRIHQTEIAKQIVEAAKQEADAANRAKSEFLAAMSHELRTPLNSILGFAEGLQEGILGNLTNQQLDAVATIERSGNHLLSLIDDILDLAKIDSGRVEINQAPTSFTEVCTACVQFLYPLAQSKNIQLTSEIIPYRSLISIDPLRVRQILINLLNNGIKFTPPGGQVSLKAEVNQKQSTLEFHIKDTGIGIASSDLSNIFEAFVQLDSNLNRQHTGTGLGLTLVKRLVDAQQGSIEVESQPNQGSCFHIRLPYQPVSIPSQIQQQPRHVTSAPLGQGIVKSTAISTGSTISTKDRLPQRSLILLAEDNEDNVETVVNYLTHYQHRVIVAHNGGEAIQLTLKHHPDIILMDIQMPTMDGLEAIQHIRRIPNLGSVPIIALTAMAMPRDKECCIKAGANFYLTKPVNLKELNQMIQELVQDNQHRTVEK
ncbi:MAG: response regulator [Leptolyngbyaceae cyanobacterium]